MSNYYFLSKTCSLFLFLLFFSITAHAQNVGIGTALPNTVLDVNGDFALREGTAVTINASNQITPGASSHVRITGTPGTINEILNPQNGKVLYLINNSGAAVVLANNTPSASLNKIFTGSGANYSLPNGATAHLIYNPGISGGAWQLAGVSPGGAAGNAWLLTGNAGTNPAINFLGTTDANSLRFRVNNLSSGFIESAAMGGNTAFGYNTMSGTGQQSVAIGDGVLTSNSAADNTGIGYRALANNDFGFGNTAVGSQALLNNTSGSGNVAVGMNALLNSATTFNNVAVGMNALSSNTSGSDNIAIGTRALAFNVTGNNNVAAGTMALFLNTDGFNNVAAGYQAMVNNTTGNYNVAAGYQALFANNNGFSNVAAGRNALLSNTNGWQNTAVGDSAGFTNTIGTGNTYLGYRADAGADFYTNSTAIGANAYVDASNAMVLGSIAGFNGATNNTNVGIGTTIPNTALDIARDFALRESPAVPIVTNQITPGTASHLRVVNTGTINEILGPQDGKVLYLINNSAGTVILANNAVATPNKIITGSGANYSLPNGATAHLIYNPSISGGAWQLAGVSPGAGGAAGWLLTGNAGTNPATNFLGTTDAQSLRFRVNNQFSGLIEQAAANGNTAFGYNSMNNLSPGGAERNVAVGDSVLGKLTIGDDNTGIGYRALAANVDGYQNIAIGTEALWLNTDGFANVAAGYRALRSNTGGHNNIAIGTLALYNNTQIGTNRGQSNIAIGTTALYNNTIGTNNVAVGVQSLYTNTTGIRNVATGDQALYTNNGDENVATGFEALYYNAAGGSNVAAGYRALYNNISGRQNTAVGYRAGLVNTIGIRNTYLGFEANANTNNLLNSTAIGANAYVEASNSMVLGSINGVNGATANTNVGIGTTIPNTALDIARDLALRATPITPPVGALVNNFDLNTNRASLYRITALTAPVTFTGFTGGEDGRIVTFHNNSGQNVTFNNLDAASAAGNRILTGTGGAITIPANGSLTMQYDIANTRWFVVSTQGVTGAGGAGWLLTGNTGTTPANFLGTTDGQSLRFRVNNLSSGFIEFANAGGNTAFGYNSMPGTGQSSVAIGDLVLTANTGINNTGVGYRALSANTAGAQNTAVGTRALVNNTSGDHNVASGYEALRANNIGSRNTAIGSQALLQNIGGNNNVAVGFNALNSNNGNDNVAVGRDALFTNTNGIDNVAVGRDALYSNQNGEDNVAVGRRALYSNIAGRYNIGIGGNALYTSTGDSNVAVGHNAMNLNTTGNRNIAVGKNAMFANTSGTGNVAIGNNALYSNTTAGNNIAIGLSALFSNTSGFGNIGIGSSALLLNNGFGNVGIGFLALSSNTSAGSNTGIGFQALTANTGGSNTGIGYQALFANTGGGSNVAVGGSALNANTTGNCNVAVGQNAGNINTIGSDNVYIGCGANGSTNNLNNSTAIGAGATVNASNKVRIGNGAVTVVEGPVSWTVSSDKNAKSEIKHDVPGLKFITQLQPVTYYYNSHLQAHGKEKSIRYTGLLAQDVDSVLRSLGIVSSIVSKPNADGSGSWGIRYSELVMPLIKGMQEQQAQIEALQQENARLEAELTSVKAAFEVRLKLLEERAGIKAEK